SGLLIHNDIPHDIHLAREIHRGLRPCIPSYVPNLVTELIIKCWDAQPNKRPTSKELYETTSIWINEILNDEAIEFVEQIKNADETLENCLKPNLSAIPHPEAIYSSRRFESLNQKDSGMHTNHLSIYIYII
ncbi:8251_t:CDS:1, partial [Dentiscutata erythropus]